MLDRAHLFSFQTLALVLVLALASAACTKTEGQSSGAPTSSAVTETTASPSAADAAPLAADTTTGTTKAAADADAAAPGAIAQKEATKAAADPTASASANAPAAECGKKPLPDCPLQGWMKVNTSAAMASSDLPAIATALDKTAGFAPPGYTNWVSISKDGAKAARAGDLAAAKASCRTCHDQYKDKYKKEMRTRKI
jgi:hypothetical protein